MGLFRATDDNPLTSALVRPGDRVQTEHGRRLVVVRAPRGHHVYCKDAISGRSAGRFARASLFRDEALAFGDGSAAVSLGRRSGKRKELRGTEIPIHVLEGRIKRLSEIVRSRNGTVDCMPSAPAARSAAPVPRQDPDEGEAYTLSRARYAKGQMLVRCPSTGMMKSRAARLADALRGRYTNRERGYVLSPSKAKRFEKLYAEGWDAEFFGKVLIPPAGGKR